LHPSDFECRILPTAQVIIDAKSIDDV